MKIRVIAGGLCGGAMGFLLSSMGFSILTLEFWGVIGLMLTYGVILGIDN